MNMKHIISLGAGVQSSTMALMAAHGEITPMPDAAIFADTGWEPKAVYDWLGWLIPRLPFPVKIVRYGNIKEMLYTGQPVWISPPLYTLSPDGKKGMIRRQCTERYKVRPMMKAKREIAGLKKGQRTRGPVVTSWLGISYDEMQRMKDSSEKWRIHRYPLVDLKMTRLHCLEWMQDNGYPRPPRSSCIGCPFHSREEWLRLSANEFEDACKVDDHIRDTYGRSGKENDVVSQVFLHPQRIPLREVDLEGDHQYSFLDECEGMCGV